MAIAALLRENLRKAEEYLFDLKSAEEDEDIDKPEFDIKLEENKPSVKELYLSFNNLDFYLKFTLFELLMFQLMTLRAKSD